MRRDLSLKDKIHDEHKLEKFRYLSSRSAILSDADGGAKEGAASAVSRIYAGQPGDRHGGAERSDRTYRDEHADQSVAKRQRGRSS